jgi:two-component system response regulator HydG
MSKSTSESPTPLASLPLLVVDDDAGQRSLLSFFLRDCGYEVVTASSGEEALKTLGAGHFGMIVSDVRMPGMSGLEMLGHVREHDSSIPILLVTAYADIRDAVRAMRDGAVDYLAKPIDLDELLSQVRKGLGAEESTRIIPDVDLQIPSTVVAESAQTRAVLREAALVAPSETRVLITGESGVGKEIIADMIHAWSPRKDGPIVKVNCAALAETLLESELFGHEKGSFTGATCTREGRFEEADGGTILLDEIAEMSPALQAKFLRVTEDGSFQRIGSNRPRKTNARVLAATNRNLETEVLEGRFREDLFYRLNVVEIYIPPLRERRADILPLANFFASRFSSGNPRISPSAQSCMELYDWPGNIREVRNAMERACLMARGEIILPEHLPRRILGAGGTDNDAPAVPSGNRMADVERTLILKTLQENKFNRTETARALGISRRALHYKILSYREQGYLVDAE